MEDIYVRPKATV